MNRFIGIIKNGFAGWKRWQIFWMIFANAVILGVSLYQGDTLLGIAASLSLIHI